jgi:hypothetical protein
MGEMTRLAGVGVACACAALLPIAAHSQARPPSIDAPAATKAAAISSVAAAAASKAQLAGKAQPAAGKAQPAAGKAQGPGARGLAGAVVQFEESAGRAIVYHEEQGGLVVNATAPEAPPAQAVAPKVAAAPAATRQ